MSDFTRFSLPPGARSGAMAIAADGTAWVADPTVSGNSQNVYQLDKTGAVVGQPTTIASTPRGGVLLTYVALQTQGSTVKNVWVSNMDGAAVSYFAPDGTATPIDLGRGARPRGLLWDSVNDLMWVADEGRGNMYAIDVSQTPPRLDPNKQVSFGSPISMLATAQGKIWATGYGASVMFSFDLSKIGQQGQGIGTYPLGVPNAGPFCLHFAPDNKRLWFTTIAGGNDALWVIDDVTQAKPDPRQVQALGQYSLPQGLAVGKAGFVWVALTSSPEADQNPLQLKGKSICEFHDGTLISEYVLPDGARTPQPYSIIYLGNTTGVPDDFLASDQAVNARVLKFTPPDSVNSLGNKGVEYSGWPTIEYSTPGANFAQQVKVTVRRIDTGELLHNRPITVSIVNADNLNNPAYATFSDGGDQATITTGPGNGEPAGVALVPALIASNDVNIGKSFQLLGYTRGQPNRPMPFFTGYIGSKPNVTGITADDPSGVYARVEKEFPSTLNVTVSGANGVPIPILYEIQPSSVGAASFKQGSHNSTDQRKTVYTDPSGHASVALYALDVTGTVTVQAGPDPAIWSGVQPAKFDWQVNPIPTTIKWAPQYQLALGQYSDAGLWVQVLSGATPCPGEAINVALVQPIEGNPHKTYFARNDGVSVHRLTPNDTYIGDVKTDASGHVCLDVSGTYTLYGGLPGPTTLFANLVNEPPNLDASGTITVVGG
ncbi:hypothetical protein [Ralstonia solanacearum]|nr:hypothetical protein [Ralstonia solanacearum]